MKPNKLTTRIEQNEDIFIFQSAPGMDSYDYGVMFYCPRLECASLGAGYYSFYLTKQIEKYWILIGKL